MRDLRRLNSVGLTGKLPQVDRWIASSPLHPGRGPAPGQPIL